MGTPSDTGPPRTPQSVATASVSGSDLKVIGEAPGSATITVTATDPGGLSANQTFEVTVAAGSGGADLDALLAPPTADEITQVKEGWDTRTPEVSGVRPELDSEVPAGLGSVRVRILSHTVGGLRHYGAVVTPVGAEPGSLPVILYAHGGDGGVEIEDTFLLNQILQLQGLSAALVIPSYRSEPSGSGTRCSFPKVRLAPGTGTSTIPSHSFPSHSSRRRSSTRRGWPSWGSAGGALWVS